MRLKLLVFSLLLKPGHIPLELTAMTQLIYQLMERLYVHNMAHMVLTELIQGQELFL